jgi:iron(III) transport system permease protein
VTIRQRILSTKLLISLLAGLLALPILLVLFRVFGITTDAWYHLTQNLLGQYVINTLIVVVGVSAFTLLIGVSTAWWISSTDFPFRKQLEWLLILPLAIPTFINGITYSGITDYTGPIRVFLRANGYKDWSLDILNIGGVIFVMALVLYPYVYFTSKAVFSLQSSARIEAARMLGASSFRTLFRVALPSAWPGIFAGLLLVIMEVLNDYGTVHYYGVATFTSGIFKSWLSLGDLPSAVLLSLFLIAFVLFLLFIEARVRKNKRFASHGNVTSRKPLFGPKKWLIFSACFAPFLLGFLIPVAQMTYWLYLANDRIRWNDLLDGISGTMRVALLTSLIVVLLAWIFTYLQRRQTLTGFWKSVTKLALLGYSMPGAVVGIGVVALTLWLEPNWLFGTSIALVIGYSTRFFAVGHNPLEAGYEKIPRSLDESARMLGNRTAGLLSKIHFPMLRPALLAAVVMVFIDIAKELPLTLILRPFNYQTLATQAFQFAKDEMVAESAAPSLMIILVAAIPVYFLHRIFGTQ